MYELKRKLKYSYLEYAFALLFFAVSVFFLYFWYQLKFLNIRDFGKLHINGDISDISLSVFVFGITFLISSMLIIIRHYQETKCLKFTIDEENNVTAKIRSRKYTFNFLNMNYLYLVRPEGTNEYAYMNSVAFLNKDEWFVMGPFFRSTEPTLDIYNKIVGDYVRYKKETYDDHLYNGYAVSFPYLIDSCQKDLGERMYAQNHFDYELAYCGSRAIQPVLTEYLKESDIFINNQNITIEGRTFNFDEMNRVVFKHYRSSYSLPNSIYDWQLGKNIQFIDQHDEILAEISLPSVLDGIILEEMIKDRVYYEIR